MDPLSGDFSEVFSEQFAAQFEETMASLMSQNPQVMQQFEKLAEAAESAGRCVLYFGEWGDIVCVCFPFGGEGMSERLDFLYEECMCRKSCCGGVGGNLIYMIYKYECQMRVQNGQAMLLVMLWTLGLNSVFRGLSGGTANIHGDADTNTSGHDAKC